MPLKRKLPDLKQARVFILFYCILVAFLDTGLPRGNGQEGDTISPIRGSIPTQSHNPKGWPHHGDLRPLLFPNSGVGSFMSHKHRSLKALWDGTYGFSSLSQGERKMTEKGRDLCWLPMGFLSRMLCRFFKNQLRVSQVRQNVENLCSQK